MIELSLFRDLFEFSDENQQQWQHYVFNATMHFVKVRKIQSKRQNTNVSI